MAYGSQWWGGGGGGGGTTGTGGGGTGQEWWMKFARGSMRPRMTTSFSQQIHPGTGTTGAGVPMAGFGSMPGRRGFGSGGGMNPWQMAMWRNYGEASGRPYGDEWKQAVAQAMQLGNRDYEGDLKRFALEETNREQSRQLNRLGSMGMRELSLQKDVQDDWAKRRQDADIRASMDAQRMKESALETMRGMLGSATGVELDRISQMIQAASAGGGNYNDFMRMLIPLMEKLGYNTGS